MVQCHKMLEIRFRDQETARHVRPLIGKYIEEAMVGDGQSYLFEVAVNEAINNALIHGSGRPLKKWIKIKLVVLGRRLIIRVKDRGIGFPGRERLKEIERKMGTVEQDEETGLEALFQESGRGLMLMKAASDQVRYNAEGNEVMLVKKLKSDCKSQMA